MAVVALIRRVSIQLVSPASGEPNDDELRNLNTVEFPFN